MAQKRKSYAELNRASVAKYGKTLYERRKESAARRGLSVQRGRGHVEREHVRRAQRIQRRYGIPEAELSDLRRRVLEHILAELAAVGTNRQPQRRKLARGVATMPLAMLYQTLELDGDAIREWASIQSPEAA